MLADFGALEGGADHPRRAITAATEILGAIERLNAERRTRGQRIAAMGIGVHTGDVIVGCLGSGSRLEFTVIGDTVNATSRLESLTKQLSPGVRAGALDQCLGHRGVLSWGLA
jgi:adenylate cyclase